MLKEIKVKSSGSFGVSNGTLAINPDHIVAATSSVQKDFTLEKGIRAAHDFKYREEDETLQVMNVYEGDITLHMITKDKIVMDAAEFRIFARSISFDPYDPKY